MKFIYWLFLNKETRAMLACISSPPPWYLLRATSKAIRKMKRKGLWQKLDNWYIFGESNKEWAQLNWKDPQPEEYPLPVIINDPKNPIQGDGVSAYIDTKWEPKK